MTARSHIRLEKASPARNHMVSALQTCRVPLPKVCLFVADTCFETLPEKCKEKVSLVSSLRSGSLNQAGQILEHHLPEDERLELYYDLRCLEAGAGAQ